MRIKLDKEIPFLVSHISMVNSSYFVKDSPLHFSGSKAGLAWHSITGMHFPYRQRDKVGAMSGN